MEEISQDDCLPFFLDDDSSGAEGSPSFLNRRPSMKSTYGFSLDTKVDKREAASTTSNNIILTSRYGSSTDKMESTSPKLDSHRPPSNRNLIDPLKPVDQRPLNTRSRGTKPQHVFVFLSCHHMIYLDPAYVSKTFIFIHCYLIFIVSAVMESLESIDQDYVLVSGPPMDVSSSSASASKPSHSPYKSGSPPQAFVNMTDTSSAPMPISGTATSNLCHNESLENQSSAPGTSQGSMSIGDALEQPSTHCMIRIKSLQQCASAITELENEKVSHGIPIYGINLVSLVFLPQTCREVKKCIL